MTGGDRLDSHELGSSRKRQFLRRSKKRLAYPPPVPLLGDAEDVRIRRHRGRKFQRDETDVGTTADGSQDRQRLDLCGIVFDRFGNPKPFRQGLEQATAKVALGRPYLDDIESGAHVRGHFSGTLVSFWTTRALKLLEYTRRGDKPRLRTHRSTSPPARAGSPPRRCATPRPGRLAASARRSSRSCRKHR